MKLPTLSATSIFLIALNFFASYNYYLLRTLKDSILVASSGAGAEVIPFAKVWLLLPASFFVAGLFTWLLRRYPIHNVFQWATASYCVFFLLFALLIYPYREFWYANSLADSIAPYVPSGWGGLVSLVRFWTFGITYVVAETWSTLICYLLLWGLANEICKVEEAKTIYPWIILAGNIAAIIAGASSALLCHESIPTFSLFGHDLWNQSLFFHTFVITLAGIGMCILLRWHQRKLGFTDTCALGKQCTKKALPFFFKSPYLLALGAMVFSFTWIINMTEVLWKDRLYQALPNPLDFQQHMSAVISATGLLSACFTLFICTPLLRKFGWKVTKLVCIALLFFSALPFLLLDLALLESTIPLALSSLFQSPLWVAAALGSVHVVVSRSTKYTLGATTKELAFIPLSSEEKLRGKGVIDGIISRIGKVGGSVTYQFLLLFLPSIHACTPWICGVIGALCLLMTALTFIIARRFEAMTSSSTDLALAL